MCSLLGTVCIIRVEDGWMTSLKEITNNCFFRILRQLNARQRRNTTASSETATATPTSRMEALIIYHQVGQIFESEFICVRDTFRAILWMLFRSELFRVRSVARARISVTRVNSAGFSKSPVTFQKETWLFFNRREFFFAIFSPFHVFTQHYSTRGAARLHILSSSISQFKLVTQTSHCLCFLLYNYTYRY
jgi:hypothetical protein